MRPTGCFQTNHSKHKTSCNFVHWHAKNTWFLVQKSQIVSKYHDNVVSIVLYWTFLGLSAPYEVVERSCAFFCILIYFTRYKMYMCVGIGWSLNLLPLSNQLPSCDFRWIEAPLSVDRGPRRAVLKTEGSRAEPSNLANPKFRCQLAARPTLFDNVITRHDQTTTTDASPTHLRFGWTNF